MKTGAVIAIVIGVVAVLYLAVSRGLIGSGAVPLAGGGVAPNPAKNYSGYLAASTAPQVSGFLNTAIAGVTSGLHAWFSSPSAPTPAPAQGGSPTSPSFAAQPSGPSASSLTSQTGLAGWFPGPSVDPSVSYNSTPGSAFDYGGLAAQNAYDPSTTLYDGAAFA